MKTAVLTAVLFAGLMMGCTADVFDGSDAGNPFFELPRHSLRLPEADAGTDGAEAGQADGGCSLAIDPVPYCAGVCALADGGQTCGNASNGACVPEQGFYAECATAGDCASQGFNKICALADVATITGTCPASLGSAGHGVTISCADPSYLSVQKSARPLCRTSSPGDCTTYGFSQCVAVEIAGYPSLAGEAVGVCE